jgi:hypothetical protein
MLVYTQSSAYDLAQALLEACEAMDKKESLDCITIDKMSGLFVCTEDATLTEGTWVAVTRDQMDS